MSEAKRAEAYQRISHLLNEVADCFKGAPKITLLVRPDPSLGISDGDFVMTNDLLNEAVSALLARKHSETKP